MLQAREEGSSASSARYVATEEDRQPDMVQGRRIVSCVSQECCRRGSEIRQLRQPGMFRQSGILKYCHGDRQRGLFQGRKIVSH